MTDIPNFWNLNLSSDEKRSAHEVYSWLGQMDGYCSDYAFAVDLILFAEEKRSAAIDLISRQTKYRAQEEQGQSERIDTELKRASAWFRFGIEAAILSLYHFRELMHGVNRQINAQCPTIKALIDQDKHKASNRLFERTFPNYTSFRDHVAHKAHTSTDARWQRNITLSESISQLGIKAEPGLQLGANYVDDKIVIATKGKPISLSINRETAATLAQINKVYLEGFLSCG